VLPLPRELLQVALHVVCLRRVCHGDSAQELLHELLELRVLGVE